MSTPPPTASNTPPPPPFLPPDELKREELDSQQVKIQVTLFITFLFFATVLILGRLRSRGGSTFKLIATTSFIITGSLISFIPGLMSVAGDSNDLYIFWVAFMAYLASVSNELSCYTLGDNEDRKKRLVIDYSVVWPLIATSLYRSLASPDIIVPIVIIFWIVVLKLRERSRALAYASRSSDGLSRVTHIVSDFAEYQRGKGENKYLVGLVEAQKLVQLHSNKEFELREFDFSKTDFVTLDGVLESEESLFMDSKVGKDIKDTCHSFSLFSVLLAKIAGHEKVDVRMLKGCGILTEDTYRLIETEIEFLYDYLFTNYYAIYERGIWKKFRDLVVVSLFFFLTIPLLVEYRSENRNALYVILWNRVLDNGYTRFVIIAIIVIEITQIAVFFTSKWAKVMYTCSYLGGQSLWVLKKSTKLILLKTLIRAAFSIPRPRLGYFSAYFPKRRISQYSILDSYSAVPLTMWCKCWIGSYFDVPRLGQTDFKVIGVPEDVQVTILDAINTCLLGERGGEFTNGVYFLDQNEVDNQIISTYITNVSSQAQVNLIWHIATSMLEKPPAKGDEEKHFQVATIISNYSAYLTVFLPHMLPGNAYKTRCDFDKVIKQLKKEAYMEDDYEALPAEFCDDKSILSQARNLKKELDRHPNKWKMLAEFWTERFMFLALSDHGEAIEAHADSLCLGGEYITHIWALLLHAGCTKKSTTVS